MSLDSIESAQKLFDDYVGVTDFDRKLSGSNLLLFLYTEVTKSSFSQSAKNDLGDAIVLVMISFSLHFYRVVEKISTKLVFFWRKCPALFSYCKRKLKNNGIVNKEQKRKLIAIANELSLSD